MLSDAHVGASRAASSPAAFVIPRLLQVYSPTRPPCQETWRSADAGEMPELQIALSHAHAGASRAASRPAAFDVAHPCGSAARQALPAGRHGALLVMQGQQITGAQVWPHCWTGKQTALPATGRMQPRGRGWQHQQTVSCLLLCMGRPMTCVLVCCLP